VEPVSRKRFVTSDMSTDRRLASIAEANPTAALMWPWFICAFDDSGRMAADPIEVRLTLFPAFGFTSSQISEAVSLFAEAGLAESYEVDGKPYLAVSPDKWFKYQTYIPPERRVGLKSKFPEPPSVAQRNVAQCATTQREVAQNVLSLSLSSNNNSALSPLDFWNQHFYPAGSSELAFLNSWDELEPSVVMAALQTAVDNNVRKVSYVRSVLKSWFAEGVRTEEDLKRREAEREQKEQDKKKASKPLPPSRSTVPTAEQTRAETQRLKEEWEAEQRRIADSSEQ
jgi:DnaD/phage-associated family protein